MKVQDVSAHWAALHQMLGLGTPIATEVGYLRALAGVDDHRWGGLIGLAGKRRLNARQIKALTQRFKVAAELLLS